MNFYDSQFTGQQIDDAVGTVAGKGPGLLIKKGAGDGKTGFITSTNNELIDVENGFGLDEGGIRLGFGSRAIDAVEAAEMAIKPNENNRVAETGKYEDLIEKPEFKSGAFRDAADGGDANSEQLVSGSDSRLRDRRDPLPHTHVKGDIVDFNDNAYVKFTDVAPVALTGQYVDILNAPNIDGLATIAYVDGRIAAMVPKGAAPASPASPGQAGQVAYDQDYVYVCVSGNTWRRAALSSW